MPTYKQRPHTAKKTDPASLPLYRPMDRLAERVVQNRRKVIPLVALGFFLLIAFGAFKAYSAYYEDKASSILNGGELEVLVKDYGRSHAARVARMKLGKMALDSQEYDRAIEWYQPIASDAAAPNMLRIAAQQNLALAYLKKNDSAKAKEWLERATKDQNNASNDYSSLLLARVHEVTGDKEKAVEIYRTLSEGSTDQAVKIEAEERRKWLENPSQ